MEKTKIGHKTLSKGIFFAIITLSIDGFQTIVNKTRPAEISALLFAWITACIELCFLFPFFIRSLKKRSNHKKNSEIPPRLERNMLYRDILKIIVAGIIFAFCAYFLILGFTLVDSVTGILAVKTQPISSMIIGAIMLKERLSWKEILIGIVMLVLIMFITTQGTFQVADLTIGVIYLLIVPIFWNIGHSLAKPFLKQKRLAIIEFVFIRISITSIILGIIFGVVGNWSDLSILATSQGLFSIFCMGLIFALSHNTWYQTIKELPLGLASLIVIPSPIITAVLVFLITHEPLYYYHYIGIVGEIIGLYCLILIQQKKNR